MAEQKQSPNVAGRRQKVPLKPGHSLVNWYQIINSGKNLSGVHGMIPVTPQELEKHSLETDMWIALNGKVYNITQYSEYHPGGVFYFL